MKLKKSFYLVATMLLVVAMLLTGCGDSGAKQESKPDSKPDSKAAQADSDYPKRPVTIIVPYAAGGGADLMARATAAVLEKEFKQPFVVTIKAGASGALGMKEVATAKPDGYTLILTSTGACTLAPNINNVGYTNKEFAPIAQVADVPSILATNKNSPFKTLPELFAYAEKNPGVPLTYGTSGAGSIHNVSLEGFQGGINKKGLFKHMPFTGGAEAVTALLGQHTALAVCIATEIIPQLKSGDFIPLAISSPARYPLTKDVPTFKELGYGDDIAIWSTWYGFAAPAGTPEAVLNKLEAAIQKAAKDPKFIESFNNINQPVEFLDRKAFTEKWLNAYEKNKKIIEIADMKKK